jgi:hypothetical protein
MSRARNAIRVALLPLATLAGLAGCGRAPSPGPAATPDAVEAPRPSSGEGVAAAEDYLALERGSCFGTCPVYRVTLTRSGAVTFKGRRFVADSGTSYDSIPAPRADSLFRRLEAAGWSGFAGRYAMGEPGCGRFATDLPTVATEVSLGGSLKRVEHDHGCQDAPEALDRLEQEIDSVAGVARWVGR